MRGRASVALAATATLFVARAAEAEPLPPGAIGVFAGGAAGTGADNATLGVGYLLGASAAWQPMSTDQWINWCAKWTVAFGTMSYAEAARVGDELLTLQLDLMPGIRIRRGQSRSHYIALRAGGALLRTDQVIPDRMSRVFVGAAASIGYDWFIAGWLVSVDAKYAMIGTGPTSISLTLGIGKTGP